MLRVTKIFQFETAHAIDGYDGMCKNIHGHSYELHVTVSSPATTHFLPAPGFVIDFKDLKDIVKREIVDFFDHRLILSRAYVNKNPALETLANLEIWDFEPSAENILFYVLHKLQPLMPKDIEIIKMKIFETRNSYAEWERD